jgi:hypothetical protein
VLDLRSDPGGLVDEAAEIADEFLESGTIYTTRHRGRIVDEVKAAGGGAFTDIPTVVLVNEYSASASELVAGALQDQSARSSSGRTRSERGAFRPSSTCRAGLEFVSRRRGTTRRAGILSRQKAFTPTFSWS